MSIFNNLKQVHLIHLLCADYLNDFMNEGKWAVSILIYKKIQSIPVDVKSM